MVFLGWGAPSPEHPHLVPLTFETGSARAPFFAHGQGFTAYFEPDRVTIDTASGAYAMVFRGANPGARMIAEERQSSRGPDGENAMLHPSGEAPAGQLRYASLYPGIDLIFHGPLTALEYDFVVEPGANPARIELEMGGATVEARPDGSLALSRRGGVGGALYHHRPFLYQEKAGARVEVAGRYVRSGPNRIQFAVGPYDRSLPLVIDPVMKYSASPVNPGGPFRPYRK